MININCSRATHLKTAQLKRSGVYVRSGGAGVGETGIMSMLAQR